MADECEELICRESPFAELRKSLNPVKAVRECPLDRQSLGNYSWSVLHTFAAYYPQKPSEQEKQSMLGILKGYRDLYPCRHCRSHFQRDYDKDPPNLQDREQLSLWVCRQHNNVNKILGRKLYPCNYASLIQRWKTGCANDADQL